MKKQYILVYSNNLPEGKLNIITNFEYIVNSYINDGWKLEGGVSITWHQRVSQIVYAQALSKDER